MSTLCARRHAAKPSAIKLHVSNEGNEGIEENEDCDFEDDEERDYYLKLVLQIARELLTLVPVVGPAADALDAAKEGNATRYVVSWLWCFADLVTLGMAEEVRATAVAASEAGRLVRLGKKGVQLRKLAIAAKAAKPNEELSKQLRFALGVLEKILKAIEKNKSDEK